MLSELAAAVVLCKHPRNPGARASLELVDTAIACDTFDLVRTDPRMPATRYLAAQLITEPMILHPHATGTRDNDEAEIRAISEGRFAIGDWYAVKGALGHGLGASGLVSLVVACCCARAGRRPPMPWLHRPLPPIAHQQSTASTAQSSEIENPPHAIFAAGFAGHAAAAVIRRQPNGFS